MELQQAIRLALNDVENKISKGKFYPDDIDLNIQSTEFGDPENVHTIAAMYAQYVIGLDYDVAISEIEDVIVEKYPWCIV